MKEYEVYYTLRAVLTVKAWLKRRWGVQQDRSGNWRIVLVRWWRYWPSKRPPFDTKAEAMAAIRCYKRMQRRPR